jgi:hypothetical protein
MIFMIHDPVYAQDVVFAVAEPNEQRILAAVLRAGYHIEDVDEMADLLQMGVASGKTVSDRDSGAVVIRLRRFRRGSADDIADLAHECVHAATMLFDRVGFPLEATTDEPLAYYVGFLVRESLRKLHARR